jgi:uncharacterized protein YqiB (DUF1249 family)
MSSFHPVEKSFWLHRVCESNYRKLTDLVPDLTRIGETSTAKVHGKPALHLRLLERSPYTLTVELTHDFSPGFEVLSEPAVRIRVFLDARTAEVLCDHARPELREALREAVEEPQAVLDYKWAINYFLARWLDHCLSNEYRFRTGRPAVEECLATP